MPRFRVLVCSLLCALAAAGCGGLRERCAESQVPFGEACVTQKVYDYSLCIRTSSMREGGGAEDALDRQIIDDCYQLATGTPRTPAPVIAQPKDVLVPGRGCEIHLALHDARPAGRFPFVCGGMRPDAEARIQVIVDDVRSVRGERVGKWRLMSGGVETPDSTGTVLDAQATVDSRGAVQGDLRLVDCAPPAGDQKPTTPREPCVLNGEARVTITVIER